LDLSEPPTVGAENGVVATLPIFVKDGAQIALNELNVPVSKETDYGAGDDAEEHDGVSSQVRDADVGVALLVEPGFVQLLVLGEHRRAHAGAGHLDVGCGVGCERAGGRGGERVASTGGTCGVWPAAVRVDRRHAGQVLHARDGNDSAVEIWEGKVGEGAAWGALTGRRGALDAASIGGGSWGYTRCADARSGKVCAGISERSTS
jgi:hypothetical protein